MKPSPMHAIVAVVLCVAPLCGGQADSPKASTAAETPSLAQKRAQRDAIIDAYVREMRADLSDGKVKIINTVMNLSNEEAKVFWPIYKDYESELFDLGDQRIGLIRRFASAQQSGKLEQQEASDLADGYFKFEQQRLELLKKYHGVIAKDLSPLRAAQFVQIEHRVGIIVDLSIAAELPLIQGPSPAPSR